MFFPTFGPTVRKAAIGVSSLAVLLGCIACTTWQAGDTPVAQPTHVGDVRITLEDGRTAVLAQVLLTNDSLRGIRADRVVIFPRSEVVLMESKRPDADKTLLRFFIAAPILTFLFVFGMG